MFIPWNDPSSVRLTGRWSKPQKNEVDLYRHIQLNPSYTTTTALGSFAEIAYSGKSACLYFDLKYCTPPFPHLYLQLDNGPLIETAVDSYLRIESLREGKHILKFCLKSSMEMQSRWYMPIAARISFLGIEANKSVALPQDTRRMIEFVGDSITEGVFTDMDHLIPGTKFEDQQNRVYQDDCTATYAWLTAKALNMRPMIQAYGAIGVTRSGNGGVPRAALMYPYVFDTVPNRGEKPDIVVVMLGTNDRRVDEITFAEYYQEFLHVVAKHSPQAKIVCLSPFEGYFDKTIQQIAEDSRLTLHTNFVSGKDWLPGEPRHPTRKGHKLAAQRLTAELIKML